MINWLRTLHIPKEANLSPEASDLILRMCCDPQNRLGRGDADEVKSHPFFQHIRFETLRQEQAPYTPKIKYATDTSNFDDVDPDKLRSNGSTESLDMKRDGTYENGKHPEHAFFEFTFRRFFDDGGHPYPSRIKDPESKLKDPDSSRPVYV